MIALVLLGMAPIVMWVGQTIMLKRHGLPIRWRIDSGDVPREIRDAGRVLTQATLAAVILAYPALRGETVLDYYGSLLPWNGAVQLLHGMAAAVLFLCALFGAWLATEQLQIELHASPQRRRRRLILLVPTTLFGALIEELLFRGVVLADLLAWLPSHRLSAVALAVLLFAAAHYVRRVKRSWTFPGHLMLGLLLCVAFLRTGSLWLAVGLHAGGILMIMGFRPFLRYRGPAWLTGASTFPFAGIAGIAGLAVLTVYVARHYGVR